MTNSNYLISNSTVGGVSVVRVLAFSSRCPSSPPPGVLKSSPAATRQRAKLWYGVTPPNLFVELALYSALSRNPYSTLLTCKDPNPSN